ncbi:cryptochrome/photolyase family protein [Minwuia sp.]|uniref:cryptochrome/photolyase family protein n=1 Tax=Minwuia sp. TaxID=2493630 RepID=UPI003A8D2656
MAASGEGRLILVLGDQLSKDMASLSYADPARDTVLMAEVAEEATYVPHHKKKIAFIFSAMRHFRDALRDDGWTVRYVAYDDDANTGSLGDEVARAVDDLNPEEIVLVEPGEWRLMDEMSGWKYRFSPRVRILNDERFLCTRDEFAAWADGRKQLRMEYFYREMRRKTGLLMDGDDPEGGEWNYDSENRKPPKDGLDLPERTWFEPDEITLEVLELVASSFPDNFGSLGNFRFAVTSDDAEKALDHFISDCLPDFGDYQDAMMTGERFMFHSLLSIYINAGLLDPLKVCERVEKAYRNGDAPLNAAEGFIRQIIGWREYVRGVYWLKMPDYAELNEMDQRRSLPDFYWTAETKMACVRQVVEQTRDEAYAHHIQRLMVTGNFAMLLGVKPVKIHEWYLAVYADAYEWVELPNTLGMSQFADGGLLGSKPYAAGGNYINRMSDYCAGCDYSVSKKAGPDACPFNYLYWDFLARKRDRLEGNRRLSNMYATYDRMSDARKDEIEADALKFRRNPK